MAFGFCGSSPWRQWKAPAFPLHGPPNTSERCHPATTHPSFLSIIKNYVFCKAFLKKIGVGRVKIQNVKYNLPSQNLPYFSLCYSFSGVIYFSCSYIFHCLCSHSSFSACCWVFLLLLECRIYFLKTYFVYFVNMQLMPLSHKTIINNAS